MNLKVSDKCRMKVRKIGGILLCTAVAAGMVGCGSTNDTAAPSPSTAVEQTVAPSIEPGSLTKELYEAGEYTDELSELDADMFDAVYQTVDLDLVKTKAAYVGSGASAEQIVVIEAKDKDKAAKIKEQLSQKLQDDIDQNQDYLPEEVSKLEKPVLVENGPYVILCVSNNNDKIEQVLTKKGIVS